MYALFFCLGKPVVLPFSLKVYSHRSRSAAMHIIQMHLDILGIIPRMSFSAVNVIVFKYLTENINFFYFSKFKFYFSNLV